MLVIRGFCFGVTMEFEQLIKEYQTIVGAIIGGILTFAAMVAFDLLGWIKRMGKKFITAVDEDQLDKKLDMKLTPLKDSLNYLQQLVLALVKKEGIPVPNRPPSLGGFVDFEQAKDDALGGQIVEKDQTN